MLFTRDDKTELTISRIERGRIRIGDATLTQSTAVTAKRIIDEWNAVPVDKLTIDHLEPVLAEQPELIILGTGWQQVLPQRELTFALARRGVGLECMDTPAACRTFNILIAEGRRTAAVLMLD